jgi:hypothetical protein
VLPHQCCWFILPVGQHDLEHTAMVGGHPCSLTI